MTQNEPSASDRTIVLTLPLPPKELSPNARVHWRKKARIVKAYRKHANWTAWYQSTKGLQRARIEFDFYFATNRRRDKDNLIASMKPAMDGFADAGVVRNDNAFDYASPRLHIDETNPRVVVTVVPLDTGDTK